MPSFPRSVLHWDGDRFFASIEQASDHKLRNHPVAVGGKGRGVVLSASREALRFGVRPGMPMTKARRLCPALISIPAHFDLYEQISDQILGLCQERTPLVEPLSVGAAFLDLTGTSRTNGNPAGVAQQLSHTIGQWLRVSISTGMAGNKSVARIAARLRKPGGQLVVPAGQEAKFLSSLPLSLLPGLSPNALGLLRVAGLARIGELAQSPLDALELVLGARALPLQRLAQGIDQDPVRVIIPALQQQQWREQVEFPKAQRAAERGSKQMRIFDLVRAEQAPSCASSREDIWEEPFLLQTLREMLERAMAHVREGECLVRGLTLELRYTDRVESRRSITIAEPSCLETDFLPLLAGILRTTWSRRVRIRSLSLQLGRVYSPSPQLNLFEPPPKQSPVTLALAIDALRRRFGDKSVVRGYALADPHSINGYALERMNLPHGVRGAA
ncbi:MAG: hypothetical protein JJE04_03240 [Acidobacteriia bacterium]|nr:hypothetical protein [Terriglobia bacterium]